MILSPTRSDGNWLESPADADLVLVRQIFSDWRKERPDDIHIDRIVRCPVACQSIGRSLRWQSCQAAT